MATYGLAYSVYQDPNKFDVPDEIGNRFTKALEAIALSYQAKIPDSVSVEDND